jgi:hypothetical protein
MARHELPKSRLNFLGNQSLSVSGAENQMDANIGVGMGHVFLQSPRNWFSVILKNKCSRSNRGEWRMVFVNAGIRACRPAGLGNLFLQVPH